MDDFVEHERALAASVPTKGIEDPPKRRRGRWDVAPATGSSNSSNSSTALPVGSAAHDSTPKPSIHERLSQAHRAVSSYDYGDGSASALKRAEHADENRSILVSAEEKPCQAVHSSILETSQRASSDKRRRWDTLGSSELAQNQNFRHIPSIEAIARLDPDLPALRTEDYAYFSCLFDDTDNSSTKRRAASILLKIKNGSQTIRRQAMRELHEEASSLGVDVILDLLLPLLTGAQIDAIARHNISLALCQVVAKAGFARVKDYMHRILVAVEPMLMDEDSHCRAEGKSIICTIASIVGVDHVISTLHSDAASSDEYVRGTTARILAILASIDDKGQATRFIHMLCDTPGDHYTYYRLTGLRAISFLAQFSGLKVLPQLSFFVKECLAPVAAAMPSETLRSKRQSLFAAYNAPDGTHDSRLTIAALAALSSLAEAVFPHGIETFEFMLPELYGASRLYRGKARSLWLRSIAALLPLMVPEQGNYFARLVIQDGTIEDVESSDIDCRRFALKLGSLCATIVYGDDAKDIVERKILPILFNEGWSRRTVADRRALRELVEATFSVAQVLGSSTVLQLMSVGNDSLKLHPRVRNVVPALKDSNDALRNAAVDVTTRILSKIGVSDLDERIFAMIVDAFLELPVAEDATVSRLVNTAWEVLFQTGGVRLKPVIVPVASAILWRMANKAAHVRRSAACLARLLPIAVVSCQDDQASVGAMAKVGSLLIENLNEQVPEVLASIVLALSSISDTACSVEISSSFAAEENPIIDIADLLPRITPILRSKHEVVQEACLSFVCMVADKMPEAAGPREWMRICFELIDMLRAQRRSIRRLAISAFGSIARAIGPQDVLSALLSNLRVQERQNRVCTTLAIGIVAERCAPFAVLPMLLCEYRVPEVNVQNGVLKSIAYMLEHVSAAGRPYVYALAPVLEDALTDRDQVHRQTATVALRFLSLCMAHHGGDDVVCHLLNASLPSVLDPDPHLALAIHDAVDAARLTMGPGVVALYLLQGLFHAARRIRSAYWRLWNAIYLSSAPSLALVYPTLHASQLHIDGTADRQECYTHHLLDVQL